MSRSPRPASAGSVSSSITSRSPAKRQQERPVERQTNFKVVIRVRPPLPRELSGEIPFQNIIAVDEREQQITVSENLSAVLDENGQLLSNPGPYSTHTFMFDHVYDQMASQKEVYETTARSVVSSALQGYNATIFAYGQTGTGKTFTMEGFNREGNVEARGIIPRAIEQIFGHIQKYASPRMRFLVRASYLQIYNEAISDLLKPERSNLTIREDKKRGVFVDGLSEWVVRSPAEIYGLMERGGAVRATGETKMNEVSSRSHAVFIVIAEQSETVYVDDHGMEMSPEDFQKFMHGRGVRREQEMNKLEDHVKQSFKIGKLNLVDLAGSERVRLSGATGQRLEESKQINRSLSALGNVISALTEAKERQHIPYRDSKLTRMLEDSLGGNCKTTMMAMVSPALEAMVETLSTLKFANRAKNIRNEARVNEDLDQKSLLRKYERELKKLRAELEERNKNVVDKRRLLELDEQRRRAEADKMTAIKALEARSLEFMKEKEEKKKLEQRIAMLMSQMIRGEKPATVDFVEGAAPVMEPEMQEMMKEQQDKLRREYEFKLADLERERETIEEEKAQVDRYKQLLLKQRDIMIALTQRLVERDEQIMALQDELDAYDRHHKELEEKLDEKTAMLIRFQRISMEVNATSPFKNEELSKALDAWSHTDGAKPSGATEIDSGFAEEEGGGGGDSVASRSRTNRGPSPNSTAEEKTRELNAIIAGQRMQIASMSEELAEARANSVRNDSRIERMFAEETAEGIRKLELSLDVDPARRGILLDPLKSALQQVMKRIQQRESSFLSQAQGAEEVARLQSEKSRLEHRVRQLESGASHSATAATEDSSSLQARCDLLVKEREAVHTIMEQKIKVLVQGVANSLNAVMQNSPQAGSPAGVALSKDVAALQRLVNASIAALRNAAAVSAPGVVSAGSGSNAGSGSGNGLPPTAPSTRPRSASGASVSSLTSAASFSNREATNIARPASASILSDTSARSMPSRAAPPPPPLATDIRGADNILQFSPITPSAR